MKGVKVRKSGKNATAMVIGPFWYIYKRMYLKGVILLLIAIFTLGLGLIPVWIYHCVYQIAINITNTSVAGFPSVFHTYRLSWSLRYYMYTR